MGEFLVTGVNCKPSPRGKLTDYTRNSPFILQSDSVKKIAFTG